jgi:hypothetical protein
LEAGLQRSDAVCRCPYILLHLPAQPRAHRHDNARRLGKFVLGVSFVIYNKLL